MVLSGHASQPEIYSTIIALSVLSGLAVILRLITRLLIVRQSGWDDVFITISYVLSVVMGVTIWKQANYGMGLHIETVSVADTHIAFRWFWMFLWLYYASLGFTKLSILLQYLRIFKTKKFLRACYALIAVVFVWSCWAVFSSIFTCSPVERFWKEPGWATKGCLPRMTLWYTNASVNIVTDLATALLPLPVIIKLDIPKRQKVILICVFAAGIFTCFISILRLVYIYPLTVSPDFTWNSPLPTIWSTVETNTAIICSCVPTFKGLVQRFFPKLLASLNSNRDQDTAATASTEDSMLKSKDSEKSPRPFWRVGQKLSVSNFQGVQGGKTMNAYYNSRISEDEERLAHELSSIPDNRIHRTTVLDIDAHGNPVGKGFQRMA